jgi:hypothetical protein
LFNSQPILRRTEGPLTLAYFLDDPAQIAELPNIDAHMRGLAWMASLFPNAQTDSYDVVWLGAPQDAPTIGGAAGPGMLLANYRRSGGGTPLATALYVPLHEAFHKMSGARGDPPIWVSESLATCFGARALRVALSDSQEARAVFEDFRMQSAQFDPGLIEITHQVRSGNRTNSDGFYAKGLAFWDAVDTAMQRRHGGRLETRLLTILRAEYDAEGRPPSDFGVRLGLEAGERWVRRSVTGNGEHS